MPNEYSVDVESITTRRKAEEIVTLARQSGFSAIDLSKVEFVSRSVADELIHQSQKYDIELVGLSGDVESMIRVVRTRSAVHA